MDSKAQKDKISVQELVVNYQAKVVTTETPDNLNLGWEGFGKEICFKLNFEKELMDVARRTFLGRSFHIVGPSKDI